MTKVFSDHDMGAFRLKDMGSEMFMACGIPLTKMSFDLRPLEPQLLLLDEQEVFLTQS